MKETTARAASRIGILAACLAAVLIVRPARLSATMAPEESRRLVADGLDHFYSLEYDDAISDYQKLRADDPRNPAWQNRIALGYLYKRLYVAGVLEGDLFDASNRFFRLKKIPPDPGLENRFQQANQTAIRLCEQRLKENAQDKPALYACGVAYAMRATHQGLVERSALDFISDARKANDYHSRLVRLDPRYYDAYLVPGIFDFVLGSLPGPIRVLLYFGGLSGDKQRGMHLVKSVAEWGDGARYDAQILLSVMYRREKRFDDARRMLEKLAATFPRNYIAPLEVASLYRAGGNIPEAIRIYEQVLERARNQKPNYPLAPLARIHFELGQLYRRTGDLDSARRHLEQVSGSRGSTPELDKEAAAVLRQLNASPER